MDKKITLQDIFNAAVQKFIVEKGEPSVDALGDKYVHEYGCKYISSSGRKCAIGLVLPDGHPLQISEVNFPRLVEEYPELWSQEILDIADNDPMILVRFQNKLHDGLIDLATGKWKLSLEERIKAYFKVAHEYKLSIPDGLNEAAAARFQ